MGNENYLVWQWVMFFLLSVLWVVTFIPIQRLGDKNQPKEEREAVSKMTDGVMVILALIFSIGFFVKLPVLPAITSVGWRIFWGFVVECAIYGIFSAINSYSRVTKS